MSKRWLAIAVSVCALAVAPSTALAGGSDGTGGQEVSQSQSASNQNSTEQSASSEASSYQTNVNAPVTVDSPGSNNGDVNQGNRAENNAYSSNNNSTDQQNQQDQAGSAQGTTSGSDSCGCEYGKKDGSGGQEVSQSQTASNENDTYQSAASEASAEPTICTDALKLMKLPRRRASALLETIAIAGPKRPVTSTTNSTDAATAAARGSLGRCVMMRMGAIDASATMVNRRCLP